jgi:hypothetical protein
MKAKVMKQAAKPNEERERMLLCAVGLWIKNNESIFDFVRWLALIVFVCDLSRNAFILLA